MANSLALNNVFVLRDIINAASPKFGAVPYSTRTAALAGTDSTAAITAALATGKNVFLPLGYYKWTGGVTMNKVGQQLIGSGTTDATGTSVAGTCLVKASGTGACLTLTQTDNRVDGITFDGNSLAGNQLYVHGTKYSEFSNLGFIGQGGTDYAVLVDATANLNSYRNLSFADGCYGDLKVDGALYQDFYSLRGGSVTSNTAIDLGASTQTSGINFYGTYMEGKILCSGNASSIRFNGLQQEAVTATQCFQVAGSEDVSITDWRMTRGASTSNIIDIDTAAINVRIKGWHVRDTASLAAQGQLGIDGGCFQISIEDVDVYSNNAFTWGMTSTVSSSISMKNVNSRSGGAGTVTIKGTYVTLENSNFAVAFSAGADQLTLTNVSGAITRTNATALACVNCSGDTSPVTTLTANSTTPSVAMAARGVVTMFKTANSAPTTVSSFTNATTGMTIQVNVNDANTTIDFSGTTLKGNAGSDWSPALNDSMQCTYDGTNWYCVLSK